MLHRRQFSISALLAVVLSLAFITNGWAGDRAHDNGFFLRLSAGGGAASSDITLTGFKNEMSGGAGDINFAIGGIVTPNLALHGTIFGWSIQNPDVTFAGLTGEADATVTMSALGVGITYYAMPANIYFSPTIGVGKLNVDTDFLDGETDYGFAGDMTIGKEWWVGDSWGLGVAGSVGVHSIPEKNISEKWSGASFAIRFTATLN